MKPRHLLRDTSRLLSGLLIILLLAGCVDSDKPRDPSEPDGDTDTGSDAGGSPPPPVSPPPVLPPPPPVSPPPPPVPPPAAALPHPLYGVTTDSIDNAADIIDSLQSLSRRPTTRVVFDEFMPATYYSSAVQRIHEVSYVLGELLDSSAMSQYSPAAYEARTVEYLDALGTAVDIWEVGNEVNGEWLGDPDAVAAKVVSAYDQVKQRQARTALTLYYNEDCWLYPWEEMFSWAQTRVPQAMKDGLDYVLVSYYEDDCNDLQPDWPAVFAQLGRIFPKSHIGFGEVGTTIDERKEEYINRYYRTIIDQPAFIGGYFWWYFRQDMVPKTQPLWQVLDTAFAAGPLPVVP